MENSRVDQAALAFKVLDGKASAEERQAFDRWLSQDTQHWEEFADLKLLWENSGDRGSEENSGAFEQIRRLVERDGRKRRLIRTLIYLLCLVAVGVLIFLVSSHSTEGQRGKLHFDDAILSEVIDDVQRVYRVEIECDERILNCRFTGIFYGDQDAETIVYSIAKSLNVHMVNVAPDTFKLTGSGCDSPYR